jgi:putative ABC transport system substrate-binding protein
MNARANRREFITLVGAAAAWPLAARAQQPAMPVLGFLDSRPAEEMGNRLGAFRRGLREAGYVEGENVRVEYRWAENRPDRLPELAAELVRREVNVILTTGGNPPALAAKMATNTIPIVFMVGQDPVGLGLVGSLARPSANLTGINVFSNELEAKRLELLCELVPKAARVAVLVNPADVQNTEATLRDVGAAADAIGVKLQVLNASTSREIDGAFEAVQRERPDALFVAAAAFLNIRRIQLVQLAAFHRLAASYSLRESVEVGGLMSYGPSIVDAYYVWASYAGRILKGAKPADLPVVQASKFELVINHQTARMLGLSVPPQLLARADEVIE